MARNVLDIIAGVLVIIGGINWGLVGLLSFNLVEKLLGAGTLANIVYDIVGIAALYMIYAMIKME